MILTVEFLGLARRLTQQKESSVEIDDRATLRHVLVHLAADFPALLGPIIIPETFALTSSYMILVDGRCAATDLDAQPQDGQRLILMFSEAGG